MKDHNLKSTCQRFALIVALIIVTANISGCRTAKVFNITIEPLPTKADGSQYTSEEVKVSILEACRDRGWIASVIEPGLIAASIRIRTKHYAEIEIRYSNNSYKITYKYSENLKYWNGRIHRNYNRWIVKLLNSINKKLGVRPQVY